VSGQGQGYNSCGWGEIQWEKAAMGGWEGGEGVLAVCQRQACIHIECMRYTFMHIYLYLRLSFIGCCA